MIIAEAANEALKNRKSHEYVYFEVADGDHPVRLECHTLRLRLLDVVGRQRCGDFQAALVDRRPRVGDVDGVQLLGWHPDRAPVHASNPALRTTERVSDAAF